MEKSRVRVLFLCTGNSCRSQMAEGWARRLKGGVLEAYSAGIEKHGMNPDAARVMAEAGVDLAGQYSKILDELPARDFDLVITLCDHAAETCPVFPGAARRLHRSFPDPPRLAAGAKTEEERLAPYRRVRDEIRTFVEGMPGNLPL
ncbi:MAG: arsenate reductase ArsC [Desulfobacteraceae bacterium]|nr:arsenate reductase ArsC [Desulfobacteraceae bacterium]